MSILDRLIAVASIATEDIRKLGLKLEGKGSSERVFDDPVHFWREQLQPQQEEEEVRAPSAVNWYEKAARYWDDEVNCGCNIDGMLGGFEAVNEPDVVDSLELLRRIKELRPDLRDQKVADCGAGIGRVTRNVLLDNFDEVDLIEQSPRLIAHAPKFVGRRRDRVNFLCMGLQDFMPEEESYDVIWVQWVIGHLHDLDLVKFLQRCRKGLRKGGLIVLKDNACKEGDEAFILDEDDSSVMRSTCYIRSLINQSGCTIILQRQMDCLPEELHPVWSFVLE